MLLSSYNNFCVGCCFYDCFFVQRFYTVHIKNCCVNAIFLKKFGSLVSRADHLSACDDSCVSSLCKNSCLVHFKRAVVLCINILNRISSYTDVCRFLIFQKCLDQLCCLETVAWKINSHVRDRGHSSDILCGMMAHSKSTVADSTTDSDKFYICVGVCNINFALLIASCGKEAGRRSCESFFATVCKTCRYADKILLSDSHLNELLRICVCKRCQRCRSSGVTAENNDIFIGFRFF